MSTPISPARIRNAVSILRVVYLPVMKAAPDEDWRQQVDASEALADLLDLHAGLVEFGPPRDSRPFRKAVTAVVVKIEMGSI